MGKIHYRGVLRASGVGVLLWAAAGSVACGGGDDDSGAPAGGAGKKSAVAVAKGGSDSSGGASDTGGAPADGGKGGSSGKGGAGSGGKGGSGGSTTGSGGSGAKGGSGGTGGKGGSTSSGGSGGSGGNAGASTTNELLDEIGAACKTDCDAQFALDCAPQNTNTLTCQLSCAASTAQLGDFCLEEYRDYVLCRGNGGYDCVQSTPYPRSTCAVEQLAYSQCTQHIGCKRYCEKTHDLGCNDTAFDDCLSTCTSEMLPMPSSPTSSSNTCAYQLETIAYCQATSATKCSGDALEMPAACASSVLNVAGCINDNSKDMCDGWCWAANRLGCGGTDCAGDCATKTADTTCGSKWNDLLDCVLFFGDAECSTDGLIGNGICDSEMSAYKTCMSGGTTN
jgi:hypothetical protein